MARRYPLTVIREPEQFDEYFNQHKEGNLYCLFTGAIEESTGKSWCPDCIASEHTIESFFDDQEDIYVLVCLCVKENYKGHPEHPYRTNPLIKLQSIPTVIRYFNGVEKGRVVERDCKNEDMLYDLADL